jgi:hypothetical protein
MPQKTLLLLALSAVLVGMSTDVRAQFPTGSSTPKVNPPFPPGPKDPFAQNRQSGSFRDPLGRSTVPGGNRDPFGRNQQTDPFGRSAVPGPNSDRLGRDRHADPWNRFPRGGLPPNHPDRGNNRNSFPDQAPRLNPEDFNHLRGIPQGAPRHYSNWEPSSPNPVPARPWTWTWARKGPPLLVAAGGVLALLAGWWFFGRKQAAPGSTHADHPSRASPAPPGPCQRVRYLGKDGKGGIWISSSL